MAAYEDGQDHVNGYGRIGWSDAHRTLRMKITSLTSITIVCGMAGLGAFVTLTTADVYSHDIYRDEVRSNLKGYELYEPAANVVDLAKDWFGVPRGGDAVEALKSGNISSVSVVLRGAVVRDDITDGNQLLNAIPVTIKCSEEVLIVVAKASAIERVFDPVRLYDLSGGMHYAELRAGSDPLVGLSMRTSSFDVGRVGSIPDVILALNTGPTERDLINVDIAYISAEPDVCTVAGP